jgi:predicted  nucleic acid-binding Zn-ribbon protein
MNEEMQRTMQFILEQQAQLTVNLDRLSEKVDKLTEVQAQNESRTKQLEESFLVLVQLATNMDERMDTADERMHALTEAQRQTDERLSAFINAVERYISERRNGDAQS